MAGSLPSWWRPATTRLSASRPVRLFGDEEQYLSSDEEDDGPDEDADFQWWDGPGELEYDIDLESNSELFSGSTGPGADSGLAAGADSSIAWEHDREDVAMEVGETDRGEMHPHACPTCGQAYNSGPRSSLPREARRTLADSVLRVIDVIAEESLTVGRFLAALCWGDPDCVANGKIRNVRSAFMRCPELPKLLLTWWKPPRSPNSHKSRPQGARNVMEAFAKHVIEDLAHEELGKIDPLLRASGDDLSKDDLTKLNLDNLESDMRMRAPTLWSLLENLCKPLQQSKVKAIASKRVLSIISMLSYTRSHFCNRIQRLLGIYFKFKGLTAKGCDTLHALGISMSAKWITNSVETISSEAMKEVQELIHTHASFLSYDNVYMTFRIFSQRLEKNGHQTAGTAATVYVKKDAPLLDATINRNLQHLRRAGMEDTITSLDVVELAEKSAVEHSGGCPLWGAHYTQCAHILTWLVRGRGLYIE
ncbi:hypothetical protein GSI_01993 [Ganoderma sinense ZZ0214-1]|uniref:Uncharacterized protein n=1 Tax=Ganoderma sinense ZZ0214-1 TaxID=1077348 RepID=A0A2G8SNX0_9APHY|nr:hypothetical protein GSI_01993 [Ganoderma sinense ZZ0214-1]